MLYNVANIRILETGLRDQRAGSFFEQIMEYNIIYFLELTLPFNVAMLPVFRARSQNNDSDAELLRPLSVGGFFFF